MHGALVERARALGGSLGGVGHVVSMAGHVATVPLVTRAGRGLRLIVVRGHGRLGRGRP